MYNLKLVERFGAYQVITIMFMFKVLAGVILFFATVNRDDPESLDTMVLVCLLIGYIIFNRVLTEGVCKLLSLQGLRDEKVKIIALLSLNSETIDI